MVSARNLIRRKTQMSTPLDLATSITGSATGMEGTSVNTMTNYTYTFVGVNQRIDDANQCG